MYLNMNIFKNFQWQKYAYKPSYDKIYLKYYRVLYGKVKQEHMLTHSQVTN